MPAPLPNALRQRAVNAYLNKEGSYKEIAERFHISHGSIEDWVRRSRQGGSVSAKTWVRRGRKPHIDEKMQQQLKKMMDENIALPLEELKKYLKQQGVKVSVSTICRTLRYKLKVAKRKKLPLSTAEGAAAKKNVSSSSKRLSSSSKKVPQASIKRARTSA